jgi:hypothetical protein
LESPDDLYYETAPDREPLVGIEIVEGPRSDRVATVRPIFGGAKEDLFGKSSGPWSERVKILRGKPGYAVGGMKAINGKVSDGFCLTFMKMEGERLDPRESYDGPWVGERNGVELTLGGDGRIARGLLGRVSPSGQMLGFGLVFRDDPPLRAQDDGKQWYDSFAKDNPIYGWTAESAPQGENKTRIVGGEPLDPEYLFDLGDEGDLVGFEFGLDDRFGREVVTAIRPIAGVGGKQLYGNWFGRQWRRVVEVRANSDDVVTALRVYGREKAEGVRVTFSRLGQNGEPYTNRSYESDPVGYLDEQYSVSLSGFGRRITGLAGRSRNGRNTGLGLVLGPSISKTLIPFDGGKPSFSHEISPLESHAETFAPESGATRWFGSHEENVAMRMSLLDLAVGMEYILGQVEGVEIIVAARPLFHAMPNGTRSRQSLPAGKRVEVRAKDGYALGGARIYGTLSMQGMRLTFCRIRGGGLDPADSYEGPMVGRVDERNFAHFRSRGRRIGDIQVRTVRDHILGIQFREGAFNPLADRVAGGSKPSPANLGTMPRPSAAPSSSRPRGTEMARLPGTVTGRIPAPGAMGTPPAAAAVPTLPGPFVESTPPGSMMVGLEVGLKKGNAGESKVASLLPIYFDGSREVRGTLRGAARADEYKTIRARSGDGVVAMVVNNESRLTGIQLRFAPGWKGRAALNEHYESEWIGKPTAGKKSYRARSGEFWPGFAGIATDEGIWQLDSLQGPMAVGVAAFQQSYLGRISFGPSGGSNRAIVDPRVGPNGPGAARAVIVPQGFGATNGLVATYGNGVNYGTGLGYGPGSPYVFGARYRTRMTPPAMVPPRFPTFDRATPFRDSVPAGSWLVGFEATLSSSEWDAVVTSVRPIFRKDGVETHGVMHGTAGPHRVEAKAPDGFAVAALAAPGGITRDGFEMSAMKIVDDHLNPRMQVRLPAIGGMRTTEADWIGLGSPVRAVFGRTGDRGEFVGMGFEFATIETAAPDPWKERPEVVPFEPKSKMTHGTGGYGSGRIAGSAEGPVTTVEFGLVEWFGRDVIGAIHAVGEQPFFKLNEAWNWERKVRIDAKPGYALSGMRVYGEPNADGVRLIFSRLKNGALDPTDSYESEPVGDVRGRAVLLSSFGRTVHGLYVSEHLGRVNGVRLSLRNPGEDAELPLDKGSPPKSRQAGDVAAARAAAAANEVTATLGPEVNPGVSTWKSSGGSRTPLLGFEVGLAKRDDKLVVCGLRLIIPPSFGGLRERTDWYGSAGAKQVRVEAEPGYALSAVRVFGKERVDGLRATFSRIDGDRLDIDDGYNAEPVGTVDEVHYVQLSGQGRPIAGLRLAGSAREVNELGLRFADDTTPATKKGP